MTFSLSIHADYRCRNSGACCTAGWPIPIADESKQRIEAAARDGRLTVPQAGSRTPLFTMAPDGKWSAGEDRGACVFYEAGTTGLCAIHRQLGEAHLPPSCRHFPRVALLDARGISVTLSHYCPTAAAMLFRDDVPLAIVSNPPAFPEPAAYEGLDARHVLPPLLRPGLLWDFDGYSRWEHEAVALLARDDMVPENALRMLKTVALEIEAWQPGSVPLQDHVASAFSRLQYPRGGDSRWGASARAVNRYLAARLFASWVPYKSTRLLALVEDVSRAHDVLTREAGSQDLLAAIRATDLRIVHAR